jgi:hypothetical protein
MRIDGNGGIEPHEGFWESRACREFRCDLCYYWVISNAAHWIRSGEFETTYHMVWLSHEIGRNIDAWREIQQIRNGWPKSKPAFSSTSLGELYWKELDNRERGGPLYGPGRPRKAVH